MQNALGSSLINGRNNRLKSRLGLLGVPGVDRLTNIFNHPPDPGPDRFVSQAAFFVLPDALER